MSEDNSENNVATEPDEEALNEEASRELEALVAAETATDEATEPEDSGTYAVQSAAERIAVIEALIFVSEDPLTTKTIADVLREDREVIDEAVGELAKEFNGRNGSLDWASGRHPLRLRHRGRRPDAWRSQAGAAGPEGTAAAGLASAKAPPSGGAEEIL